MRAVLVRLPPLVLLVALVAAPGCSMATKMVANTLSKPGDTFTSDDVPVLVNGAIPFGLKLNEIVLQSQPTHGPLLLSTCSGFTGYSYGFVEGEAEVLGETRHEEAKELREQAVLLYVRARDYCLRAIDLRFKGMSAKLYKDPAKAFDGVKVKKEDVPLLYWTAASWGAAINLGLDRPDLIGDFPAVRALADTAMKLDP
jgi:hypothetical protein